MSTLRPAAVAGAFYPGERKALQSSVKEYLRSAAPSPLQGRWTKAIIAPHAGYVYSGAVAGYAFSRLRAEKETIRRVVLLGPPHRWPVSGLALPEASAFETPLGVVPVDEELVGRVRGMSQISVSAAAHAPEHCLEVELPFLQEALGEFSILPLLVGTEVPQEVVEVLDRVWGGRETRIVVSSDLSHYQPYDVARQIDHQTADQILALACDVGSSRACGADALNGFLAAAKDRNLEPELLDLRNSGDTAGDRNQVVGYGAFAFYEPS
jgi:AmmeMemoRadiSam system protein B